MLTHNHLLLYMQIAEYNRYVFKKEIGSGWWCADKTLFSNFFSRPSSGIIKCTTRSNIAQKIQARTSKLKRASTAMPNAQYRIVRSVEPPVRRFGQPPLPLI